MIEVTGGLKRPKKNMMIIGGVALLVIIAVLAGYFYWQWRQAVANPNASNDAAATRVTSEVDKLYALPTDEKPTVAQIQDKSKLASQQFFDKAQNGDYVLIYQNNKLALLYREKDSKLINVGPVTVGDQNQTTPATTPTTKK
jgi:hypothetical protein